LRVMRGTAAPGSEERRAMFEDKTLTCRECDREFIFTAGEQEFYAERGFQNTPSRCKECRDSRRAQGSARSSNAGGGGGRREMFDTVCAECGKDTKVPFRPRLDKPVYCSECFAKHSTMEPLRR
jgi:CxxC-x17-CxxC domain-containing protein